MKQEPGKRIVSKGEFAVILSKEFAWLISGTALCLLSGSCVLLAGLVLLASFLFPAELTRADWVINSLFEMALCVIAYVLARLAGLGLKRSQQYGNAIPFTRANINYLSLPDSLVRASQEPLQAQESVLLRAATETTQKQEELLRASSGGQE